QDPFLKKPTPKPPVPKPTAPAPNTGNPTSGTKASGDVIKPQVAPKPTPPPVVPLTAPPIEQRIAYYKQMRDDAIQRGLPLPKVTSVLTLDEMAVSGISKTSKGYAAMVEAKPLKLSYTIYPGEKFFDSQLVAVEENKLVFRKVTEMSNGKMIASMQERTLREYSFIEDVQGTSPVGSSSGKTESANNSTPANPEVESNNNKVPVQSIISPLERMNQQPTIGASTSIEAEKAKARAKNAKDKSSQPAQKTANKKPVKVASKTKNKQVLVN
nr:hypothetical protein [Pyrinomonadaceae bacterium]